MRLPTLILTLAFALPANQAQTTRFRPVIIRRANSIMSLSGAQKSKSFPSATGKYLVVINDAEAATSEDINITVTISKRENQNADVLWRTDAKGLPAEGVRSEDILISDDHEFVLLAATERWTLFRKGLPPVTLGNQRFTSINSPPFRNKSLPNLIAIDQLDKKPVVRIWHADSDRWDAFDIGTNEKTRFHAAPGRPIFAGAFKYRHQFRAGSSIRRSLEYHLHKARPMLAVKTTTPPMTSGCACFSNQGETLHRDHVTPHSEKSAQSAKSAVKILPPFFETSPHSSWLPRPISSNCSPFFDNRIQTRHRELFTAAKPRNRLLRFLSYLL
jgi:hypothetical protein